MSEVFSIQISKHGTDRHIWLDLPTTAEQVAAAMGQIGVTRDNPWDYTVSGFSVPEGRHLAIPYDLALASGVNELNFLAARLEKLDAYEIGTLNAALQQKNTELRTISRIIDYPDNLDWVVDRISFLRPLSGEKPSELQIKARQAQQEKPSIRAQLKAAKEGQQQKAPTKDKSQDLEV